MREGRNTLVMQRESKWHNPGYPDYITAPNYEGDTRNVIDHYKAWTQDAIKEDLAARALPVIVVAENFAHDFNIATLVRNANAFNMEKVAIVGRRSWDKRGAVGTYHYTPIERYSDAEAFYAGLKEEGVTIIVLDNIEGSVSLPEFTWPQGRVAVVFGQEDIGVSNLALSFADHVIAIPQRGSVRSLNVGTASGITLYDYVARGATP